MLVLSDRNCQIKVVSGSISLENRSYNFSGFLVVRREALWRRSKPVSASVLRFPTENFR